MDGTNDLTERQAALKARRERICAYADRVLEAVEAMDMPKTIEEAGRATRLMAGLDRLYVRLYSEPRLTLNTLTPNTGSVSAPRRRTDPPPEPVRVYTSEEGKALSEAVFQKLVRATQAIRAARGLPLEGAIDKETYLKADREYAEKSGNGKHYKPPVWFPGDPWPEDWQANTPQDEPPAEPETDPALEQQAKEIFDAYLKAKAASPGPDAQPHTGPP